MTGLGGPGCKVMCNVGSSCVPDARCGQAPHRDAGAGGVTAEALGALAALAHQVAAVLIAVGGGAAAAGLG